ncbi:glycosyltransferase [Nocardioides ultimimeridianus]
MVQAVVARPELASAPHLRVAVIQQAGILGGAERWQLQLADVTDRLKVSVLGLGEGHATDEWRARGWDVTSLPNPREPHRMAGLSRRVRAELARLQPDVVLAHGIKAGLVGGAAARSLGIPIAWVRHDPSFEGWIRRLVDRMTDGQLATSHWLLDGTVGTNTLVITPPRRPVPADRHGARALLGIDVPDGQLLVGMGTRLTRTKGVDDAIRALAYPAAGRWSLVIAGIEDPSAPEEAAELVSLATELGVGDRVHFIGEVPDFGRVVSAFDAVAVLTKPTPEVPWFREAFGMAALEAITGGVPVIAAPPVEELVLAGGIAVSAGAPAEVARALGDLASPDTHERISAAASARAQDFPDDVDAARSLVDFLAELAHRPGAGLAGAEVGVSVVTTVLNDRPALAALIGALAPQLGPDDELVVVDGGSTDGTHQIVTAATRQDARIRLVVEDGAGISRGRNVGIELAKNDVIACTDAGCVPSPGWLATLRSAVAGHPDVDLFTGTYSVTGDVPWERALAAVGYPRVSELRRETPFVRWYGRLLGRGFDATMPTGRSVAFRRDAWRRVGGYPEHLQTGEDVTFGRAVVAAGGRAVLVADAEVAWAQRPTLQENLRMFVRYGEGSGNSLDAKLLGRDLARVAAYAVGAVGLASGGPRTRVALVAGGAAYFSLPLARALRGPDSVRTAALVPPVGAARDLAKAYGAVRSLAARRSRTAR